MPIRSQATYGLVFGLACVSAADPVPHPGRYGQFGEASTPNTHAAVSPGGLAAIGQNDEAVWLHHTPIDHDFRLWSNSAIVDPADPSRFLKVTGASLRSLDDKTPSIYAYATLRGTNVTSLFFEQEPDDRNAALMRGGDFWLLEGDPAHDQASFPGYRWSGLTTPGVARRGDHHALVTDLAPPVGSSLPFRRAVLVGPHHDLNAVATAGVTSLPNMNNGATLSLGQAVNHIATNAGGATVFRDLFWEPIAPGSGASSLASGLVLWTPDAGLTMPVRSGDIVDGHTILGVQTPTINAAGDVAFGSMPPLPFGPTPGEAIFRRASDGTLSRVAGLGDAAPGFAGHTFDNVGLRRADRINVRAAPPLIDDDGRVSFIGMLSDDNGATQRTGVWRHDGQTLRKVIADGDPVATTRDGNEFDGYVEGIARLRDVFQIAGSPSGLIAVSGEVVGDPPYGTIESGIVLIGHQGQTILVDAEQSFGDAFSLDDGSTGTDGRLAAVNDFGQVAYTKYVASADQWFGRVYTPRLVFDAQPSGDHAWEDDARWTLGVRPAHVHDVSLATEADATLHGPTQDTAFRTLSLGGGDGRSTLRLRDGVELDGFIDILGQGELTGNTASPGFNPDQTIREAMLDIRNAGVLAPQDSFTATWLNQLVEGELRFSLDADDRAADADAALRLGGFARLDGTLRVVIEPGLEPALGDVFPLMAFRGARGDFHTHVLPTLRDDLRWDLRREDTSLSLAVVAAALAGDYNGNGQVEQGDLNLVLNNWGSPRPFAPQTDPFATANVDQEELNRVLNHWGNQSAPNFAGFAVPEPTALLAFWGLGMLRRAH
ncbi:MAG: choice-of-anchor tandem repeat NxxGxxAF-containing protein [Planctomycetota bacterium]